MVAAGSVSASVLLRLLKWFPVEWEGVTLADFGLSTITKGDATVTESHRFDVSGTDENLHRVVVFSVPDDPHQLRDVVALELGISKPDAQIQVHSLPGVLPATLPKHQAAVLAQAIRELGVNATSIPSDQVPAFKRIQSVRHLRCIDDEMQILGLRGNVQRKIAWNKVALISVGMIPHHEEHRPQPAPTIATQLATSHGGRRTSQVEHEGLELLLVTVDPHKVFRIDHAEFNYEYLGRRMTTAASVNFRLLIQDLVKRANAACVTPATRSFLEHGLARHHEFGSFDEMLRYTIFHLIICDATIGSRVSC